MAAEETQQPAGPEPLEVERTAWGLSLRGTQLVLDPRGRASLGFLAHAQRTRGQLPERVIATAGTLALLEASWPKLLSRSAPLPAQYGKSFALGPVKLSLHPAGLARGSAWLRCELDGKVIAWAPDLGGTGPRAPRTAEPRAAPSCDTLVLRAVYGHPRYLFPPRAAQWALLEQFVSDALAAGQTPVVLAAPLGGAQEAVKQLGDAGHRLRLHPTVHRLCLAYEKLGVTFQDMELFEGPPAPGEVVVLPYGARPGRRGPLGAHRTVLLSGRALEEGCAARAGVDLALPLSDHAGFDELVQLALHSDARRVLTIEGFAAELAQELRARGLDACALGAERQLELF
jgi:putative mRNA 3-end processing factor